MNNLPKVLIVDDEIGPRIALQMTLKLTPGGPFCEPLIAETPSEALELLAHQPDIALVVVDLRMPEMLGTELFVKMRKLKPSLRGILHTAYDDLTTERDLFCGFLEKGMRAADQEYIRKVIRGGLTAPGC